MILVPHLFCISVDNEKSPGICWWWLSLLWLSTEPLHSQRDKGENQKAKVRKLMAGYEEFIVKSRATQAGNLQKGGNPFSTSISQESRVPSPINLCPPSPSFICWAWCTVWSVPWVSWAQLSCPRHLPDSAPSASSCLLGQYQKQSRAGLCVGTAQLQQKHPHVSNAVSSTNLQLHYSSCEANELPQPEPVHSWQRVCFFPVSTKQQLKR